MFGSDTIILNAQADSDGAILQKLAELLHEKGYVKETYIDAILAREKEHPTGLPTKVGAIAIPHTEAAHVNETRIAVATLADPVEFAMMGSPDVKLPVTTVFMLAVKNPKEQPAVLMQLMKLFQDGQLLAKVREAEGVEAAHSALSGALGN